MYIKTSIQGGWLRLDATIYLCAQYTSLRIREKLISKNPSRKSHYDVQFALPKLPNLIWGGNKKNNAVEGIYIGIIYYFM